MGKKKKQVEEDVFKGIEIKQFSTKQSFGIGHFPPWKQWCLYEQDAHGIHILTFIKRDEDAEQIANWLERLLRYTGAVME